MVDDADRLILGSASNGVSKAELQFTRLQLESPGRMDST